MNKKAKIVKQGSTFLLRGALLAMGAFIIFLCVLMFPVFLHTEGNDHRLIVAALYIASIPFHYALYQAWLLLNYIDKNRAFSLLSVNALKTIKICAIIIAGLFTIYLPLFMGLAQDVEAPGIFAIGLMITFMSAVIAVFTALLQKLFQNAVDIKAENDLTV